MPRLATPKGWGPPVRRPSSEPKKVAILGGSFTLGAAPWDDPTWKLWAHASCRHQCLRKPDLLFDLHPKALWSNPVKKHWDPHYVGWLKQNTTPIYMQQRFADAPASLEYPKDRILAEFGAHPYFTNQVAWMIALALTEGVTHIGIYGCDYARGSEYERQRGSAEFWCGVAIGRGVQVCLPKHSPLLREPALLYGYESHPDGVRDKSYSQQTVKESVALAPGTPRTELTILSPDATPQLRPVLGPDGKPTGIAPARELWTGKPITRAQIYTATSIYGGEGPTANDAGWLTWQNLRALATCEWWDGRITAPFREWAPGTVPKDAPVIDAPSQGICYTRQPWLLAEPSARAFLEQFDGVLVTAFCDPRVTQAIADAVLTGTKVRQWFAVQVDASHPKLTAMPLGIDRRDVTTLDAAPRVPWAERKTLLYTNVKPHTAERKALVQQMAAQGFPSSPRVEPAEYFAALGNAKFVLSPPGLAWDCYRTYEALAMGALPIVRRQAPISTVVTRLPVLAVNDWAEVTPERLEQHKPNAWNLERMTLAYWAQRIKEYADVES